MAQTGAEVLIQVIHIIVGLHIHLQIPRLLVEVEVNALAHDVKHILRAEDGLLPINEVVIGVEITVQEYLVEGTLLLAGVLVQRLVHDD